MGYADIDCQLIVSLFLFGSHVFTLSILQYTYVMYEKVGRGGEKKRRCDCCMKLDGRERKRKQTDVECKCKVEVGLDLLPE